MAAAATDGRAATTLRTFIAIDLPDAVKQEFMVRRDELRDGLAAHGLDGALRWSDPHGLHLTLRFLGETAPRQCYVLAALLQRVMVGWRPFTLQLGSLGAFPKPAQPRVVWLGLTGELARLAAVQTQVEAAVQEMGFAPEAKSFTPHITLARVRREAGQAEVQALGRALAARFAQGQPSDPTAFVVDHLVHYRSDLRPGGAVYTPLAVFPLAADEEHPQ